MKSYQVTITETVVSTVTVRAESADEAREVGKTAHLAGRSTFEAVPDRDVQAVEAE